MDLKTFVIRRGMPFIMRYWKRFALGILLGILFGIVHAGIMWGVNVVISRIDPTPTAQATTTVMTWADAHTFKDILKVIQQHLLNALDPFLPLMGRPLDTFQIIGGMLFFAGFALVRGVIGYLSSYCLAWASDRVMTDLKCDALVKLNSLSMDYFNRSTLGDMITRINQDTAILQRWLSLGLSDLIKEPVTIISALVYLFAVEWKLTLMALIYIPILVIPISILGRKVRKYSTKGSEVGIQQSSVLIESLSNMRVAKAFGLEKFQEEEFRDYARRVLSHSFRTMRAKELMNPVVETLSMLSFGLVIVYVVHSGMTFANMTTFFMGLILMATPIKKLTALGMLFQQTHVALERLRDFYEEEPSVQNKTDGIQLQHFNGTIEFKNVSFSYGDSPVLKNVNFSIRKGESIGLAGESGCGKSTLINLLFRFYDVTEGQILVDGHDIRDFEVTSLRSQMALVSQEAMLYNRTVSENIAFGKLTANQAEIEQAARLAHATPFIQQMPDGFNTIIGERGLRMSGGQRQRLTIARAFVRNAPILALDEATASLDSESEAEVQAALDLLSKNRTVFCVAHRLSTLSGMNKILVFSKGSIIEEGTFTELIQKRGHFSDMARKQGITA
ncbi:MAG: ABC transporter transmembrane domain-containing protein [Verrucomicrobiota bacterium]